MQKNRLIMCLLSSTLLFSTFNINTKINPFQTAGQPIEKVDLNSIYEMVKDDIHRDRLRIQNGQYTRIEELHKERLEMERKVRERLDVIERQRQEEESNRVYCDFVLTYYALLQEECGKTDGVTASGKNVSRGMVASPKILKFGTRIVINDDEYIVEDRGSERYIKVNNDGSIRLDVFIPRLQGESDSKYSKRVNDLGVNRVSGYYIYE